MSDTTPALDEAFERMAAASFELPNGFVNHGAMACEAQPAIRPSLPPRKRPPAGTPDRIAPSGPPAAGAAIPVRAGCAMADNTSPPCFVGGLAVVPPMGLDPALDACLRKVTGQVAARMSSGRYAVAAVRSQPRFPRSHLPGMAAGRRHGPVLDPSLLSRARKPGWWASSPDLAERTEPMRHAMEASA